MMRRSAGFICGVALAICALLPSPARAQSIQTDVPEKISLSTKVPLSFYGFVLMEALYSDSQLSSFGTLDNNPASYNRTIASFNRVVDESVDGNNDAFISATVQSSRFGFVLDPYDFNGKNFAVDARLELDFNSNTNMSAGSMLPRIRRAYAGIGQKSWHVTMGQEWDLFSPLNTSTMDLGGNLWQEGNLGYRRPQIQLMLNQPIGEKSGFEEAVSINLPSNSLSSLDAGSTACVPMAEARVGFRHELPAGKFQAFLSAAYARHRNAAAGGSDINNWGIAASIDAPIHRMFKFTSEFHYGYSLGSLLSLSSDTTRQREIAGWAQIKSQWLGWLESNIGYGMDTLKGSQVAANWVKRNQFGFVNVQFKPIKDLILAPEYDFMRTTYQGTGASNANVVFLSAMYYF